MTKAAGELFEPEHETPTKEQCQAAFWEAAAEFLGEIMSKGWVPPTLRARP